MKNTRSTFVLVAVGLIFAVIITLQGAFVADSVAVKVLEDKGFSNVEITEHIWFLPNRRGCGWFDNAKFKAQATDHSGARTPVSVCLDIFGSSSVVME